MHTYVHMISNYQWIVGFLRNSIWNTYIPVFLWIYVCKCYNIIYSWYCTQKFWIWFKLFDPWPIGLSDPYCYISVIKAEHLEMVTNSKHNLEQISKSKKLGLAIKKSEVIPKTLNPTWNQSFELYARMYVFNC